MFYNSNNPNDSSQNQPKKTSIQEKLQIYNGNANRDQAKPNPSNNDTTKHSFQEKLRIAQGNSINEAKQGFKQENQTVVQTSNLKEQDNIINENNQKKDQPKPNLIQERLKAFNQNTSTIQQQKSEQVDNNQNKNLSFKEKLKIAQGETSNEIKQENQQTKPTINQTNNIKVPKEIPKNENNQPKPNLIQERLRAFNQNSNSIPSQKNESVNNQNSKEKLNIAQNEISNEIKQEHQQAKQTIDQANNLKEQDNIINENNQKKDQPKPNLIQERLKAFNQNTCTIQQQKTEQVDNNQNKNLSFKEKLKIAQGETSNEIKQENQQTKPTINQTNNIKPSEKIKTPQDQPNPNSIQERLKAFNQNSNNLSPSNNNRNQNLNQMKNGNNQIKSNIISNEESKQDEKIKTNQPKSNLIRERLKIYNTDSDEVIRFKKEPNNENNSYLSFKEKLRIAKGELPNANEAVNASNDNKIEPVKETKIQQEQQRQNSIHEKAKAFNTNSNNSQPQKLEAINDKNANLNSNETSIKLQKESQSNKNIEPQLTQEKTKQQSNENMLSQEEKRNLFLEKLKLFNGNFSNKPQQKSNSVNNNTSSNNDTNKSSNINDNASTNTKNKTTNNNNSSIFKNTKEKTASSKKEKINQIIKDKFQKLLKSNKKNANEEIENTCQDVVDPSFQNSLNDLASEIIIDFQRNGKVLDKIKEIKYNILESTTIFDKKYCIVLKNSLRTYIKSVVLEIILKEYNEIPKNLIPKVYQTKINLIRDEIEKFVRCIDGFYDEKVGNDDCEEDITDKNEMEANSMLYVMSEKESFKEIKIDITCEASLRSQIPQDF